MVSTTLESPVVVIPFRHSVLRYFRCLFTTGYAMRMGPSFEHVNLALAHRFCLDTFTVLVKPVILRWLVCRDGDSSQVHFHSSW
jgi:hypothetical protein